MPSQGLLPVATFQWRWARCWCLVDYGCGGSVSDFKVLTYWKVCPSSSAIVAGASIEWGTKWANYMATQLSDDRHAILVDWLVARPSGTQQPRTQLELAESLGVSPRTVRDWAAREDVQERRRELAIQAGGEPERIKQVMDALFEQAIDGESMKQTAAATVWAKMAGVVVPKPDGRSRKDSVGELHDLGLSAEVLQGLLNEAVKQAVPDTVPAEFAEREG